MNFRPGNRGGVGGQITNLSGRVVPVTPLQRTLDHLVHRQDSTGNGGLEESAGVCMSFPKYTARPPSHLLPAVLAELHPGFQVRTTVRAELLSGCQCCRSRLANFGI